MQPRGTRQSRTVSSYSRAARGPGVVAVTVLPAREEGPTHALVGVAQDSWRCSCSPPPTPSPRRFLTDKGIEYLREYLGLPQDVVPATLKKSTK